MTDRESLLAGLKHAYGDASWVDLDRIIAEIWDPATHPQDARRYYLNQVTHASDSWVTQPEWAGCFDGDKVLADRDLIVMGFDGSRKSNYSTTDATALIGCRVVDGHMFEIGVWEEPSGAAADEWEVPTFEVDRAVRNTFDRYQVVGFYADPSRWSAHIATWEADLGTQLELTASRSAPISFSLGRPRLVSEALENLSTAISSQEMTHDGSSALTRHVLNARRRVQRGNIIIAKDHPQSSRKIDAAYAGMLAWQARVDAVSAGITGRKRKSRRLAF